MMLSPLFKIVSGDFLKRFRKKPRIRANTVGLRIIKCAWAKFLSRLSRLNGLPWWLSW